MIKFAKVIPVELEDGRTLHFKELPIGSAKDLIAFENSNNTDFESLCSVLLAVLVDEKGNPMPELKDYTPESLAANLPASEAMAIFEAYGQAVAPGNE